ncbi:MAG: M20/M25/M40 family metallo-hydrolase [Bryobacteraceae bacterium]|nr:M20/M25/M40 family metallo-hydrolase [Bryobacteraceae bacterium]
MPVLLLLLLFADAREAADAARRWREAREAALVRRYAEFLSIPNTAGDKAGLRRNAEFIAALYREAGAAAEIVDVEGSAPAVYAELPAPGAQRTLLVYAHYDGQPVVPERWAGHAPFEPVLRTAPVEAGGRLLPLEQPRYDREWRLFARSASDDKVSVFALWAALMALRDAGIRPASHLKFLFEGEEEQGSPNLRRLLARLGDRLRGDVWLICDGSVHPSRAQRIVLGARGVATVDITVYGARRGLHSGHYGNWAPNPAMQLARLLASMTDGEGRVLVKGFYDDVVPLSEAEKRALAEIPPADEELRRELGIAATQPFGGLLRESIYQPSLNVRGLESGGTGERASNEVPAVARASLDLRLVKGVDGRRQAERVIAHIREQGFHVIEGRGPDDAERLRYAKIARVDVRPGYNALRTPLDLPIVAEIVRTARAVRQPVYVEPSFGGSLPLVWFEEATRTPLVIVPISNHDDSQHTHNENIRLGNLWDGIELYAALLSM